MLNKEKLERRKQNYTSQKGITLIALIITIIVMLILVGITINVALNGGLFEKAEIAATETEKQAIYDQIVAAMVLTDDGKIDPKGTYNAAETVLVAQGKTVTKTEESDSKIVFTVEGNTYTITESAIKIGTVDIKETNEYYYTDNGDGTITIKGPKKVRVLNIETEQAQQELENLIDAEFGEGMYIAYMEEDFPEEEWEKWEEISYRVNEIIYLESFSNEIFWTVVELEESQVGTGTLKNSLGVDSIALVDITTPLPSEIGGKTVTAIGENAFYDIYVYSSNFIPNTVTSIGDNAFRGSLFVSQLIIPDSVQTIGEQAFERMDLYFLSNGEDIELIMNDAENNLISIGDEAFGESDLVGTLNLRSEVIIASNAFSYTNVTVNQN